MEFKYGAVQNQTTPTSYPLPTVTYLPGSSLQGGLPGNVSDPRVFQTPMPVNAEEAMRRESEKEQIRRELEKEEIRREIIASEMALVRRRELEEEVRREMVSERALGIPMQKPERFSVQQRISMPFNPSMNNQRVNNQRINNPVNNINIFGGPQPQLPSQIDIRQPNKQTQTQMQQTQTSKYKVIILAKPDVDLRRAKHKAVTTPMDDSEHSPLTLQKKPKQNWSCSLCQITTTSEQGLKDHLQRKKHKAKEKSLRTKKIGLDARPNSHIIQPCITPVDTGILESGKED